MRGATDARTLGDVLVGADVFWSFRAQCLETRMAAADGGQPLILALANPIPRSCRKWPKGPA